MPRRGAGARSLEGPLWTCPRCGARFARVDRLGAHDWIYMLRVTSPEELDA